jgi:hypothetical protein
MSAYPEPGIPLVVQLLLGLVALAGVVVFVYYVSNDCEQKQCPVGTEPHMLRELSGLYTCMCTAEPQ